MPAISAWRDAERERPGLARLIAALASTAMVMLAALAGAVPAKAATAAGQDVPGPQIAAALRKSPLYIDPSLASAFPAAGRQELLAAIRKAPAPTYVLAIPLVSGSQWASSQQLADVVQNSLGEPGIYLTLDADFADTVDAYTWPSDPSGLDASPYHAADAAQAADMAVNPFTQDIPVWRVFLRCIQLIDSGKAVSAYQAALAAPVQSPGGQAASSSSDGGEVVGGVLAAAAAVTGALVLARRRRRRRRIRSAAAAVTPPSRTVADAARAETEGDLRVRGQRELIELGLLLEQSGSVGADGTPEPYSDQVTADLTRALDAYAAAAQMLDGASGIPDLAGVLVLAQLGRCAAASAQASQAGLSAPAPVMLCFFNPLHGEAPRRTRWRARDGQRVLDVHACADCADAVAQRRSPDYLTDTIGRLEVPYYEAASVWAATGYGQFSTDDLLQRILVKTVQPGRG